MRPPSLRNPRSLWDVLTISLAVILPMKLVLLWLDSPIIRIEVIVVWAIVLAWDLWAIRRILGRSAGDYSSR